MQWNGVESHCGQAYLGGISESFSTSCRVGDLLPANNYQILQGLQPAALDPGG